MQINVDLIKENVKNLKFWFILIILTFLYIVIFNIAFFVYKEQLISDDVISAENNRIIVTKVSLFYVDWFLFFVIIPILTFWLFKYFTKANFVNYFFPRDAYRNSFIIKQTFLFFVSSFAIIFALTSLIQLIFYSVNFWCAGIENAGFIFLSVLAKELILLIYIPILFLIISTIKIINSKILVSLLMLVFFGLSIMNILHSNIIKNYRSDEVIQYEVKNDFSSETEQITFNFEEINLISSTNENPLHLANFQNLTVVNYKNEFALEKYSEYIINFCEGYNTEIIFLNQKLYPICNIFDYKIENEYSNSRGINLIWKNLMKSIDFEKKMSNITVWFKEKNNFENGFSYLSDLLLANYNWTDNNKNDFYSIIKQLEFENGKLVIKMNNLSSYQISLVNQFYKDIFYFYFINYLKNPLEIDVITNSCYLIIFQSFLDFDEFGHNYWEKIVSDFLWNRNTYIFENITNSEEMIKDFLYSGFNYFFKTYIVTSIYFNLINNFEIEKEIAYDYKMNLQKIKTYNLIDISSYQETIFSSLLNIKKYQKSIYKDIKSNEQILEKLVEYRQINFKLNNDFATIKKSESNKNVFIVIIFLMSFLIILLLVYFFEFVPYMKYRIINNEFDIKIFIKEIFKYWKK